MNKKTLMTISMLLLAVVGIQSFYLYKLTNRVDQLSPFSGMDSTINQLSSANTPNFNSFFTMNSKSWNPFKEMQAMEKQMGKMFGNINSQMLMSPNINQFSNTFSLSPKIDVKEKKNTVVVTADIPGADKSDIDVNVDNQELTIVAKTNKSSEVDNKDKNIFRKEQFSGRFQRSIPLPAPVIASKMTTKFKGGVLTVTIPKAS